MNGAIYHFLNRLGCVEIDQLNIGMPMLKYTKYFISKCLTDRIHFSEVKYNSSESIYSI